MPSSVKKTQKDALDQIKKNHNPGRKRLFRISAEDRDKSDFQVTVNKQGEYEIWDPAGGSIPNLNPPLKIDNSNATIRVVQRMLHLTKYSNIQGLDNVDRASPLSRKLIVELVLAPKVMSQEINLQMWNRLNLREIQRL